MEKLEAHRTNRTIQICSKIDYLIRLLKSPLLLCNSHMANQQPPTLPSLRTDSPNITTAIILPRNSRRRLAKTSRPGNTGVSTVEFRNGYGSYRLSCPFRHLYYETMFKVLGKSFETDSTRSFIVCPKIQAPPAFSNQGDGGQYDLHIDELNKVPTDIHASAEDAKVGPHGLNLNKHLPMTLSNSDNGSAFLAHNAGAIHAEGDSDTQERRPK